MVFSQYFDRRSEIFGVFLQYHPILVRNFGFLCRQYSEKAALSEGRHTFLRDGTDNRGGTCRCAPPLDTLLQTTPLDGVVYFVSIRHCLSVYCPVWRLPNTVYD